VQLYPYPTKICTNELYLCRKGGLAYASLLSLIRVSLFFEKEQIQTIYRLKKQTEQEQQAEGFSKARGCAGQPGLSLL